jgi:putative PIN family toxin of toxin-antitoxin system
MFRSTSPTLDAVPRLVLDTNVCLDLFLFRDPRCAGISAALRSGKAQAVTRQDCRAEFLQVLGYAALGLVQAQRDALAQAYDATLRECATTGTDTSPLPRCRDPDDQKFLTLACDTDALALVTRDAALLALAPRMARIGGFSIVQPAQLTGDWLQLAWQARARHAPP